MLFECPRITSGIAKIFFICNECVVCVPVGSRIQPVRGQETTSRPSSTPSAGRDHDLKKDAHSESQSTKTSDPGRILIYSLFLCAHT